MRIALVTIASDSTFKSVYNSVPGLKNHPYSEQKKIVDKEISVWTSGWENALEILLLVLNVHLDSSYEYTSNMRF